MGNKDKWSALSMKERADLIKLYVSNGITSLNDIKKDYNSFAPGGPIETDEYGYPADITPAVVTQDPEFNKFLMTLPDNLRLTPEKDYYLYKSWKMNGRPRNFQEGLEANMYNWDDSDNSYHGVTVIGYDENGVGIFGKPKHHDTVRYELDWYNKGIGTLEGGEQYPLQGEERKEWEDFRSQYQLDSTGVDYKYVPRKPYNSFDDGGEKSKVVTAEMTPSQAIKYNESADNAAFMIPYGGTPDNPEFLYPEQLEAAVALASAKEAEQKAIEKEVAKLNSSDAWKTIPIRQGENFEANKHAREYVEDLNNAAIVGIGGTLLATNPFTTELAIDALQGTGHATHVMLDPLAANTMFGAFLGTASQAAGITAGIYNAANTIDKWRSGNFNWYDIPYFALDATSAIPVINTMFGLADDAARMTRNTYNAQKAVKSNTKVGSNTSKLTEADVKNAGYINSIDDVTLNPYAKMEVPEKAFISKPNPLDEVRANLKPSASVNSANLEAQAERELYQKFINAINRSNIDDVATTDLSRLRKILNKEGIDEQLLTDANLNKLISARYHDYRMQNNADNIALRMSTSMDGDDSFHYYIHRANNPDAVGSIDVVDYRKYPSYISVNDPTSVGVSMVRNSKPGVYKGVSEQAYNAVIDDLGYVDSGHYLLSPEKTTRVWNKYSDKTLLGMHGRQGNSFDNFPVYRLNTPTYPVPIKYLDNFGLEGLSPDGTFIVDFTKGPMYKEGGKLLTKRK
jgi:hypothetical protein